MKEKKEALVPIPLSTGEELIVSQLVATFLFHKKNEIEDWTVLPMAVSLLFALEKYRRSRSIEELAKNLEIPKDILVRLHEENHE